MFFEKFDCVDVVGTFCGWNNGVVILPTEYKEWTCNVWIAFTLDVTDGFGHDISWTLRTCLFG